MCLDPDNAIREAMFNITEQALDAYAMFEFGLELLVGRTVPDGAIYSELTHWANSAAAPSPPPNL